MEFALVGPRKSYNENAPKNELLNNANLYLKLPIKIKILAKLYPSFIQLSTTAISMEKWN
jgi:hypothetical protein